LLPIVTSGDGLFAIDGGFCIGTVLVPTIKPDGPNDTGVLDMSIPGAPCDRTVSPIEIAAGLPLNVPLPTVKTDADAGASCAADETCSGKVLEPITILDTPKETDVPPMTTGGDPTETVPVPIMTSDAPGETA